MSVLNVSREDLDEAQKEGLIQHKDIGPLWAFLESRQLKVLPAQASSAFDLAHLAWYAGAGIVMIAMLVLLSLTNFSGESLLITSSVYIAGFVAVGRYLWSKDDLKVPGGVMFTLAVTMTPLAVFGIERLIGVDMGKPAATWLIEGATVAAGLLALRSIRFPFITAPVTFAALALVLDVAQNVLGPLNFHQHMQLTMGFGLLLTTLSVFIDRSSREDFGFWGYLFGAGTFWVALTTLAFDFDVRPEAMLLGYAAVNAAMMVVSVLLGRRIFLVLGTIGVFGYIIHLASIFANSLAFPFILIGVGIGIIYLGVQYHRNRTAIEQGVLNAVPSGLRNWLPTKRS